LQGEAWASQVNLRIREHFGDRHFVYRSVRYNLSTFLDAGVLKTGGKPGTYINGKTYRPKSDTEISWLVESLLHAQDTTTLPFQGIPQHGALFPFSMDDLSVSVLTRNPRIEIKPALATFCTGKTGRRQDECPRHSHYRRVAGKTGEAVTEEKAFD